MSVILPLPGEFATLPGLAGQQLLHRKKELDAFLSPHLYPVPLFSKKKKKNPERTNN